MPLEAGSGGVEVLRGGVLFSECDRMGHMNVRFHIARASQGLIGLARALGMPEAFTARAAATLTPLEHHVRFLREARADAVLHMRAGISAMSAEEATAQQTLFHTGDGQPATTVTARLAHTTAAGRAFGWPKLAVEQARALWVEPSARSAPRSVHQGPPAASGAEAADRLGLPMVGLTAVEPADCDVFGRFKPEGIIDRVALSVSDLHASLQRAFAEAGADAAPPAGRLGGAMVEYRVAYHAWPRAGDGVEVRAGMAAFDSRSRRMVYWLLDPVTGRPWATAEAVSLSFDLETRKAMTLPASVVEAMQALIVPDLTL